jgi:MFS family permease
MRRLRSLRLAAHAALSRLPSHTRPGQLPQMLRALAHRDYRLWIVADLVSTLGSWMQLIAQNWIVLELTHSPAKLGATVAVQSVPALVLGMWGGSLADRLPKRRLLIATQAMFGLLALVLALTTAFGVLNIWVVWGVALLTGLTTAINTPAVGALCVDIVPRQDLGNAMALGAATSSTGRMIGMALAAWVVASFGAATAFAANAASFIAVIVALAMMRNAKVMQKNNDGSAGDGAWHGLRYIFRSPKLLGLLGLCFMLSAFGRNFQVTMAAMVDGPLHAGAGAYGFVSTVFAIGTVVGAIFAARCKVLDARLLLWAAGIAAAIQLVSSVAPTMGTFATLMAPIAIAAVLIDTASSYLVQTKSDPAFRGRALAAAAMVSSAAGAVGGPLLGWFASAFGARGSLAIGGALALAATLAAAAYWSRGHIAARLAPPRLPNWSTPTSVA